MTRYSAEGEVPFLNFEGTSHECGIQLGLAWAHSLRVNAERAREANWTAWWWKGRGGVTANLVDRMCPHLVDLIRGMAQGAGVPEELCGCSPIAMPLTECTSFSVHKDHTLDGRAIAGQTKDTSNARTYFYQVLRIKPNDAPGILTLTYPGELLGHGFAGTGTSVFRNSLYVTPRTKGGDLPFDAACLIALCSNRLAEAVDAIRKHGVRIVAHITVADVDVRCFGLELCHGLTEVIEGRGGIYVHANHAVAGAFRTLVTKAKEESQRSGGSEHRQKRLYELLEAERGRLTPQVALAALCDHQNFPLSICAHRGNGTHTSAAVVAEPSRGLLHVTRGAPCQNWPRTYSL